MSAGLNLSSFVPMFIGTTGTKKSKQNYRNQTAFIGQDYPDGSGQAGFTG
jgi:hypothetical protein